MNRDEVLKAAAAAHTEWSLRHGDDVPYNPADEAPRDGATTDLSVWQADRSAPPEIDDELNATLYALAFPAESKVRRAREAVLHDELENYWTRGEGLKKWLGHPHEWTALRDHLLKYVGPERADRIASEWFHDVKGFWPGSDLHRVEHGKPPRGDRIGPG